MKRLLILLCLATFLFVACSEKTRPAPTQSTPEQDAEAEQMRQDFDAQS